MSIQRRDFLKISGLAGGGILFGFKIHSLDKPDFVFKPNLYVRISSGNIITLRIIQQEIGQGTATSISMMIAEELEADIEMVKTEFIPYTNEVSNYKKEFGLFETGGSGGVISSWDPMRRAGAVVREILLQAAAKTWGLQKHECYARNSFVYNKKDNRKISFGQLAETASHINPPNEVKLKKSEDYQIIGKPTASLKNKSVVAGTYKFGIDEYLPDMLFASVVLQPVKSAKFRGYDSSKVLEIDGVVKVVEFPATPKDSGFTGSEGGVAVVANSTWAAMLGKKALERAITWDEGEYGKKDIESVRKDFQKALSEPFREIYHAGYVDAAFKNDVKKELSATYECPYLGHGLMEPLNAIAHVHDGKCEIWAGSQSPQYTSYHLSKILGIELENFTFHAYPSGGGFGRRFVTDFVTQAALISRQIGLPVKLTWTREDEIQHGRYLPFRQERYRGGLDKNNNLVAVHYKGMATQMGGSAMMIYGISNRKEEFSIRDSIVNIGTWRSVGHHPSIFGRECFIDEMASLAQKDPLEFRKGLLIKALDNVKKSNKNPERALGSKNKLSGYLRVLDFLIEKTNWGVKLPENEGLGLAIGDYGASTELTGWKNSICGQIAHVSVEDGAWEIKKITVVADCGIVVNPSGAKAQIEGSINWALTPLVYGGMDVKNGRVVQSNFHDFKVLRIDGAPEIDIHFIESDEIPSGLGELAVPPLTPAVLNGIYAASGIRVRTIPVKKLRYRYA